MAGIGQISKAVAGDPGVGFGVRNAILFASATNVLGLVSTLVAAGVAVTSKVLSTTKPDFLKKHPKFAEVMTDSRTPLQAISGSLLVVGAAALAAGMWLPAAASFLFAIANVRNAESIAARLKAGKDGVVKDVPDGTPPLKKLALLAFKRADFYINAGFAAAGLMAGGAAWLALPAIALAFGVSMRNAMTGKPEYEGHPKAISSIAGLFFAGFGFATGNIGPAISHVVGSAVLFNIESRVTPGGPKRVLRDMGNSVKNFFLGEPAPSKPDMTFTLTPEPPQPDSTVFRAKGELADAFKAGQKLAVATETTAAPVVSGPVSPNQKMN